MTKNVFPELVLQVVLQISDQPFIFNHWFVDINRVFNRYLISHIYSHWHIHNLFPLYMRRLDADRSIDVDWSFYYRWHLNIHDLTINFCRYKPKLHRTTVNKVIRVDYLSLIRFQHEEGVLLSPVSKKLIPSREEKQLFLLTYLCFIASKNLMFLAEPTLRFESLGQPLQFLFRPPFAL